ncbi:recombinase family protein [Jeotgalibaca dankookensis]|uniref:recombinase family protein n=1 Tax=Jeotgalibaca dankookensis TaxID=708126 RepID=UPI00078649D7|nr:recombinase family protein [Jeotgalibaca dankookensis]
MIYGYARVSTKDQNLETQLQQLQAFGVNEVISEKISGIVPKKTKLDALLHDLKENDTLVVTRMDRLGRNTVQLLQLVEALQERQVDLVVLNMGIDTRTPTGKFFLTIMAGFSELDRTMMKEKQAAGIQLAKKKGLYKGRPKKYTHTHARIKHALDLRKTTHKTVKEISQITGVSEATLYRRLREQNIKN